MTPILRNLSILAFGLSVGAFANFATGQEPATPQTLPPGGARTDRFTGTNELTPQQFAQAAAWSGLKEIRLGELAQQKAENSDVREFGRHMVRDHSAANQKLMEIAQRKGFTLPPTNSFYGTNVDRVFVREPETPVRTTIPDRRPEPTRPDEPGRAGTDRTGREPMGDHFSAMKQKDLQGVQRLQRLSGAEFDRAYVTEMINDHSHAVKKFQTASTTLQDAELKAFASETLPTLREHFQKAQKLAKDNNWPSEPTPTDRQYERPGREIK